VEERPVGVEDRRFGVEERPFRAALGTVSLWALAPEVIVISKPSMNLALRTRLATSARRPHSR
jgi:hypothetical protein